MTNYEYGITLISLVLTAIGNDLFGIDLRNVTICIIMWVRIKAVGLHKIQS